MEDFRKKYIEYSLIDTSKMNQFLLIDRTMNFLKIKSENPNLSQGKICKMLGTSDSTMRRIRKDLGIPSPYRHNDIKKSRKKKEEREREGMRERVTEEGKSNMIKNISREYLAGGTSGNQTSGNQTSGNQTSGNQTSGNQTSGNQTSEEISKNQLAEILGR